MASFDGELVALLPRLRRMAHVLARDPTAADDLVQTAVERALARRGQFRPGRRLDAWVFAILRHAWIDQLRAERRRPTTALPDDLAGTSAAGPETLALRAAVAALPPEQRLAVALVLVEGYSYREAAQVAGAPEGTIASRVARGRAALLAQLGETGPGR